MKNIIVTLVCAIAMLSLASCDDETSGGLTRITYYPEVTLLGEPTLYMPIGATYTEAGVTALEGENDITSNVITKGSVNTAKAGKYTLTYSAMNVDGFPASVSRSVYIYDPSIETDISGEYTVAASHRIYHSTGVKTPFSGYNVTITKLYPGLFSISDFFGGYYEKRANYGPSAAMSGIIQINADNSIEGLSGYVATWGDSFNYLNDGKYTPATGELYYKMGYSGAMDFYITLAK